MRKVFLLLSIFISSVGAWAQKPLEGRVLSVAQEPLAGAHLRLLPSGQGSLSDAEGYFRLEPGPHDSLLEVSFVGYRPLRQALSPSAAPLRLLLRPDPLGLEEVVVSANRRELSAYESPIIVNRLSPRLLENVQALSLAEGLHFSPGLRVENNCQNCGFTQLRINGLDGAYSQVLVNSRPIFSALMGVYGLELFPPNMIERVEVVKGGGSALYGSNAIGGTVNIITREARENAVQLGSSLMSIAGESLQRSSDFSASVVSDDYKAGANIYAFERQREAWDAIGDGFSEITALRNLTLGLDAFWKPQTRQKLKFNLFRIEEYRRGGNFLERPPHQSDLAEELRHQILGAGLDWEWLSPDSRQRLALYLSGQSTQRQSYYGGGGRILQPGDSLTAEDIMALNAYGQSQDFSLVGGLQYGYMLSPQWQFTLGSEWQSNQVEDQMPGYGRRIKQQVRNWGHYAQAEYQVLPQLSLLGGFRLEQSWVEGLYDLAEDRQRQSENYLIPAPRFSAKYELSPRWLLRASAARGFRVPQAFDEDLHIETVGGSALFIQLSPDLRSEISNSYSFSANYNYQKGAWEQVLVFELFRTDLQNPFLLSDQRSLPSGAAVITKRNGGAARVQGFNLEYNLAIGERWLWQSGFTWQSARFAQSEEIWAPASGASDSIISTDRLLRTPDLYGFWNLSYQAQPWLRIGLSGNYTGSMALAHVIDPESEYTVLKDSPEFWVLNTKWSFSLPRQKSWSPEAYLGVQNIFEAFQRDFDRGAERDAGYVYGPMLPRSYFVGLRLKF